MKKKLWVNKQRYLISLIAFVFFCTIGVFIVRNADQNADNLQQSFIDVNSSFCFEKGDLLARPNLNFLPGTSKIDSGRMFGHMAIVVESSVGKTVDDALRKAMVVEVFVFDQQTRTFLFDSKKQVRKVSAIVPFGSRFTGIRYRLRTNLTNAQKDSMCLFLTRQIAKHRYNLLSFKSGKFDKKDLNCATFCWIAFKNIAGIDIDSNKGLIIYPNDCIKSEYFDGPERRIRF